MQEFLCFLTSTRGRRRTKKMRRVKKRRSLCYSEWKGVGEGERGGVKRQAIKDMEEKHDRKKEKEEEARKRSKMRSQRRRHGKQIGLKEMFGQHFLSWPEWMMIHPVSQNICSLCENGCNKKPNSQKLGKRLRQDLWTQRGFWEKDRVLRQMQRKQLELYGEMR